MNLSLAPVASSNRRSYGLVRQMGPWKMTESDIESLFAPKDPDPSDFQVIQPDAVGPTEDSMIPFELGGGFSLYNGSVVDPPTYDPRWAVPGRKMMNAMPLEGPGEVVALRGQNIPGKSSDLSADTTTPYTMPNASVPSTLTAEDLKKIADIQKQILATQQTGFGPIYDPSKMIAVYNKMTEAEKAIATKALEIWKTMTAEQRAQEFLKESSIMRRIFTLYKGEMPAKYVSMMIDRLTEIAFFVMMF